MTDPTCPHCGAALQLLCKSTQLKAEASPVGDASVSTTSGPTSLEKTFTWPSVGASVCEPPSPADVRGVLLERLSRRELRMETWKELLAAAKRRGVRMSDHLRDCGPSALQVYWGLEGGR